MRRRKEDIGIDETVTTLSISPSMSRVLAPFVKDDFDAGVMGIIPMGRKFSVNKSFTDGIASESVTVRNRGRRLQINPTTKEAWVSQAGRTVYLGTLDTWTDVHIRKLILRYLGVLPDALVSNTLRDLGLVENESTMSTNIATPSIGMSRTHVSYIDPITSKRKRRK